MYVYKIVNVRNGRMYFGSTNNYLIRKSEHFGNLRKGTHHNRNLQEDYNIYGASCFVFEIIHNDIYDRTKLLLKEYDLILRYKGKCYNMHTECPVFDPAEKQDWSMFRKGFIPKGNEKGNAKKKKHAKIYALKKAALAGKSKIKVDIPPFRRK